MSISFRRAPISRSARAPFACRSRASATARACRSTSSCARWPKNCGERAICVILSGTGSDGSLGLKAVKERGGLVIAQDPDEAEYDGMPRSAIMTGAVDLVLPGSEIPETSPQYGRRKERMPSRSSRRDRLAEILNLLRTKTSHDFALYKRGTLSRRIERRMAMAGIRRTVPGISTCCGRIRLRSSCSPRIC